VEEVKEFEQAFISREKISRSPPDGRSGNVMGARINA